MFALFWYAAVAIATANFAGLTTATYQRTIWNASVHISGISFGSSRGRTWKAT